MTKKTCCTGDCNQGRDCPLRASNAKPAPPEFRALPDLSGAAVRGEDPVPATTEGLMTNTRIVELYRDSFNAMVGRLRDAPRNVPDTVLMFARAVEAEVVKRGRLQSSGNSGDVPNKQVFENIEDVQPSGNSGELADTPRASAHAAVTPMFLLNAAYCIESPHEVPTFRKREVLASLHRVADELQAERMAAMKGGAA